MAKKYRNDPIIEALCEFQFTADSPWDPIIPGRIYEQVKGEFKKHQPMKVLAVAASTGGDTAEPRLVSVDRIQFLRDDGSALLQVGPRLYVANMLKPYTSWEAFKPMVLNGLHVYLDVAQPKGIQTLTLRYINRIQIACGNFDLSHYFNIYPHANPPLPQAFAAFSTTVQVLRHEDRDVLKLELSSMPPEQPDHAIMHLDMQYALGQPVELDLENVSGWLDEAHQVIEQTFEECITDKLRQQFREVVTT